MRQADLEGLFSLRGKVKLDLGPMRRLLSRLGNPQNNLRIVHFAGTNGKGSTLVTLESLLLASGFSVSSFISPHLVRFNERFRVDGNESSDQAVEAALSTVCEALGIEIADLASAEEKQLGASFFEISFAMALLIGQSSEWMLVETGLGGRLDATNGIEAPEACIITRVGLDHMEYLGSTLEEIALEKLGIFKQGAKVFLAPQETIVANLARVQAEALGLSLYEASTEDVPALELGLLGSHQQENAATAYLAYQHLCPASRQLNEQALAHCLEQVCWPARLEMIGDRLLLDGAHNQAGLSSLLTFLKEKYSQQKILLGLGWMQGKELFNAFDPQGLDLTFLPLRGRFFGAELSPETALEHIGPILAPRSITQAYQDWQAGDLDRFDLVVFAGSLYLIGELKALLA